MQIRKITKKFLIICNVIIAATFLLSLTNSFLSPAHWWPIALLGIIFPLLLLALLIFLLLWLFSGSKWLILPLGSMLIGYQHINAFMSFYFGKQPPAVATAPNELSILSWNVRWFDQQKRADNRQIDYRNDILNVIREADAEVVCFQEFLEPHEKIGPSNIKALQEMGYPYYHRVIDYGKPGGNYEVGVAIFSKLPIIETLRTIYPGTTKERAAESLIAVDVLFNNDTIRIYTTHLQSILLNSDDYHNIQKIMSVNDSMINASKSILNKLITGYNFRSRQVEVVKSTLQESPYPSIITGDFNDVPNSYTYFQIKGDKKDAFTEKGSFIGKTYRELGFTLRIDYILCDPVWEVKAFEKIRVPYSDHYPVKAVLQLR